MSHKANSAQTQVSARKRPKIAGYATTASLVQRCLAEARGDPTKAVQLARIYVVGKTAQQAVINAIATALLRAPAGGKTS